MSDIERMPVEKSKNELARAILQSERITSSTGIETNASSNVTGIQDIPKGARPVTEGGLSLTHSDNSSDIICHNGLTYFFARKYNADKTIFEKAVMV